MWIVYNLVILPFRMNSLLTNSHNMTYNLLTVLVDPYKYTQSLFPAEYLCWKVFLPALLKLHHCLKIVYWYLLT